MMTIAADPKHLGARIGITAVLHTWGSAMTHHPHIHMIVPGGGISLDGRRWISSRPAFLLPVRVLGMLFRRLFLTRLIELHEAGRLAFFGTQAGLADRRLFLRHLAGVRKKRCRVDGDVAAPIPHRPGRADFPHPVLHERGSLAAA
jgi:Putative transposase